MSSSYDSSRSRRRGIWGPWVPIVVTLTVATVGVAAWAWSQRNNEREDEESDVEPTDLDYENADYGENPPYGATGRDSRPPIRPDDVSYGVGEIHPEASGVSAGWGSRRTPSPQQFFSSASKTFTAGVAGVGAAVSSALATIRDDKDAYADHETWSEEAEARKEKPAPPQLRDSTKRRKTVAIVVSANTNTADLDAEGFHEHASILSHIPRNIDFSTIKLFVLIYAPGLKDSALDASTNNLPPASLSSSFSNIANEQSQTPGEEDKSPILSSNTPNTPFNSVYSQAMGLVEKEAMILPFTSPNGHVHILRHLQPEVIYLQESLAGDNGGVITQLQTWLKYDVILVVGADDGHGGLADSESEAENPEKETKKKNDLWWQREERVGRGRGVVVVDSLRVGDDWARRVQGKE
ncbi:hypothetical protein F5Y00DRAFT_59843 [Daldinia vernicosa]|uniref:uncharacterized protein n=1 Tax=Daldinia vernicosa TaxID=114800 RepID=UPI0020088794|nr:uncharacterized protein F5Y00DRAFT_59843 [Daldinia vernicosa]KAI0853791.1 hypothetical protein F5Y00DRAFT_59843 [Daldinia vernicosa]